MSGMDDTIRKNYLKTHPTGTILTFAYRGLTDKGVPRHPVYKRIYQTGEIKESNKRLKFPEGNNKRIADQLYLASIWKKRRGDTFSGAAFDKVSRIIRNWPTEIKSSKDLDGVKGIGEGNLARVNIILKTGELPELRDYPELKHLGSLMEVSGIRSIGC